MENIKKPNTRPWHGRGNGKDQWITFAFNDLTRITGFRYKAHTDSWCGPSFKNFRFEYSLDAGTTWKMFYQGRGINIACCEWEEINLPVSPRTTHFRLYMIDNWGASWFSIEQAQLRIAGRCNGNSCSEDQFFNKHLCYRYS